MSGNGHDRDYSDAKRVDCPLFPTLEPAVTTRLRRYKRVQQPIWTENKARFIQQYLRFFVQITKHGAYIDGFAGPQYHHRLDAWCAALVLASEPKWLRHFFLCEITTKGVRALRRLAGEQIQATDKKGRKLPRTIEIWPGDFNRNVEGLLDSGKIAPKEATFCLIDQRTFECDWETVRKLAAYKNPPNNKIEILYFLGVGWLHRAFSGIRKNEERARKWWGNSDWRELTSKTSWDIAELVRRRFEGELGYRHASAYPIFDKKKGNKVMYYMIHASDHPEAPALMVRAHHRAVRALPREVQRSLKFVK